MSSRAFRSKQLQSEPMSKGMIRRTLRIHRYMPEALAAMETSILIWIISQANRGNQSNVLLSIPDQQGLMTWMK